MIDAYVWTTPNGFKTLIALEELGLDYTAKWVDITKNAQLEPAFLAVNPNNKIPAIVDHDGIGGGDVTVFESGAIAVYLADKTGQLLARSGRDRYVALEWVFFNVGGTGPMIGQYVHFAKYAPEKLPYAIERYKKETSRLLGVLDKRLGEAAYLAGDAYSIADLMNVTWVSGAKNFAGFDLSPHANVERWLAAVEARPAVARAMAMKPPASSPS